MNFYYKVNVLYFVAIAVLQASISYSSSINLAPVYGTAKQSSTCNGGKAKYAIDGLSNKKAAKTCKQKSSWWEVDITKDALLDKIIVKPRNKNARKHLRSAELIITDAFGNQKLSRSLKKKLNFDVRAKKIETPVTVTIKIDKKKVKKSLQLSEVKVFGTINPVYVSLVGHIEDNDIYFLNCAIYEKKREELLKFASLVKSYEFPFNLQVSYEWLRGIETCEDSTLTMNILEELVHTYNFEIDAHQEGADLQNTTSGNNFADIVALGRNVTSSFTKTTGFQWDNTDQYEAFVNGEVGILHPEYTFYPTILCGGVSKLHTTGDFDSDVTASGAWTPSNFTVSDFYTHNPGQSMVYIASGPNQYISDWGDTKKACHWESSADYLKVLANYAAVSSKIFSFSFMVPGKIMLDSKNHAKVEKHFDQFSLLVTDKVAVINHLTTVANLWKTNYGGVENIFQYSEIHPSEYTNCP